jgi:hypothetical protein
VLEFWKIVERKIMLPVDRMLIEFGIYVALITFVLGMRYGARIASIFAGGYLVAIAARQFTDNVNYVAAVFFVASFAIMIPLAVHDMRRIRRESACKAKSEADAREARTQARAQQVTDQ